MLVPLLVALCVAGAQGANPCHNVFPGLDHQALGVDVTRLDLMPVDPMTAEDGYKSPVVTYTCDQLKTKTIGNVHYDVPDQVLTIVETPAGSLSSSTSVLKSSSEKRKIMTTNAGLDASYGQFAFSASTTFSRTQTSLAKHDRTVEFVTANFLTRRVDLLLKENLVLGTNAHAQLAHLPVHYTDSPVAYENFVKQFGTHYIAEGKFGGLLLMYMETSSDYLETHNEQTLEVQASASFGSFLSVHGGHSSTTAHADTTFTQKTTQTIRYYGGTANLLDSKGISAWQPTISSQPWLFSTRLAPITDLVHDTNKKVALDVAIRDYILRSYLTLELPRLIHTLPGAAQAQSRAQALLSKISAMAHKRPLVAAEVHTLGQEVEHEYKEIFLDYYRPDDGFRRVNDWDKEEHFECPAGKSLTRVESVHDNHVEDREWSFGCSYVPGLGTLTNCAWTDYVNAFDSQFTFSCPHNGIIKGWASYHDNHFEDRRHKFKCCEVEGAATVCSPFTGWVNALDQPLIYRVSYSREVIKGVGGLDNNHANDRQFSFQKCTLHYY